MIAPILPTNTQIIIPGKKSIPVGIFIFLKCLYISAVIIHPKSAPAIDFDMRIPFSGFLPTIIAPSKVDINIPQSMAPEITYIIYSLFSFFV